jgi:hypothetical protein
VLLCGVDGAAWSARVGVRVDRGRGAVGGGGVAKGFMGAVENGWAWRLAVGDCQCGRVRVCVGSMRSHVIACVINKGECFGCTSPAAGAK